LLGDFVNFNPFLISNLLFVTMLEKVEAVESVFRDLDGAISAFQGATTLHCKFGCGKCCFKPDIEATVLEFLPLAHHLYSQDLAYEWFEKLQTSSQDICLVLNPTQAAAGLCSIYAHRGLICRLFGYSARINKHGAKELITCQIIKTEQQEAYERTSGQINDSEVVTTPIMSQYYMQLHGIDPDLARDFYPINRAIRKALETVLHYYAYRN
jgi:uncharacterized protein